MHTKGNLEANGSKLVCMKGYAIATVNSVGTYEGQANAKRLVLTWNSHDALVEALEECLVLAHFIENAKCIDAATKALKAAKGE